MSMSKSHQSSSSNQSSQQSSQQNLDPDIKNALLANWKAAQAKIGGMDYTPLTGDMIQGFENPYTSQVVDASMSDLDKARQMAIQGGHANAVGQGAFGGSRTGVLDALTNKDYAAQAATTSAGLRSAGYNTALTAAQAEQQAKNQWPIILQQLLNQSLGLMGNPVLGTSQGSSTGSSKGSGWSMSGDASALMGA